MATTKNIRTVGDYKIREVIVNYKKPKRVCETITGPEDSASFIRSILPNNSQEHFCALYLDGSHRPIVYAVVHSGTATSCQIHPREIFQRAVLIGAVALIVAHNHPSCAVTPSAEDERVTNSLRDAAKCLGIKLLDSLVVTEVDYTSIC